MKAVLTEQYPTTWGAARASAGGVQAEGLLWSSPYGWQGSCSILHML